MADKTKTIPPWTKLDCYECDAEYQASRTVPVTRSRFICCCCETAERAEKGGDNDIAKAKREGYMLALERVRDLADGDSQGLRLVLRHIATSLADQAPGEAE